MPAMQANEYADLRWHSMNIAYPRGFQADDFTDFQSSGFGCRCVLPRPKPDRLRANQVGLVVSVRRPKSLVVAEAIRPYVERYIRPTKRQSVEIHESKLHQ